VKVCAVVLNGEFEIHVLGLWPLVFDY
jgi:hypothetical protein